jgi:hypothetical protein
MEKVIIHKDAASREIQTYVGCDGHGARMDLGEFLELVADLYGSPFATLTKASHLAQLKRAAGLACEQLKAKTAAVAALSRPAK